MINTAYIQLFQVQVLHTYFNQNVCSCLVFKPTDLTQKIIKRFGLKVREEVDGFGLYGSQKESIADYLKYMESVTKETSFDFDIHTTINNFSIITDIPVDWNGSISFRTDNKSNVLNKGNLVVQADYLESKNPNSIGSLTICFKDIIKYGAAKSVAKFEIQFNARSTQWQYYIVNRSAVKLDRPKIYSKTDIDFVGPVKTTIETGQEADLFTSGDHLIPLSMSPKYQFSLINEPSSTEQSPKKSNSTKYIFKGLPNPTPDGSGCVIDSQSKQVSSFMYVYI